MAGAIKANNSFTSSKALEIVVLFVQELKNPSVYTPSVGVPITVVPTDADFQVTPVDEVLSAVRTYASVPTGNFETVSPVPTKISPVVYEFCPVPPYRDVITFPAQVPDIITPLFTTTPERLDG